ncbi:MAG: cyclic-di-AMP receptor [Anaerolineae bacterium]|nr:cyclic-di-AMP receptor [Anaerolineae bacterium]MDW8299070.1 cyclic-di-AMP receptor [Anaerolineae bacterium]
MKKLIFAIIMADAVEPVSRALVERQFSVTQIASVGGFLRRGNTTLVIGVDEEQVQNVIAVIREACAPYSKGDHHAATLFVLNAAQFIQT